MNEMNERSGKKNVADIYPLSPIQEGMLYESLAGSETGEYHEQFQLTLRGSLDRDAFRGAWQRVVDRHPILRTSFVWKRAGRPLQVVRRKVAVPVIEEDWRGRSDEEVARALEDLLRRDREDGFDFGRAPLLRLRSLQLDDDTYHVVWSFHHLLLDGWSLGQVLREVFAFYDELRDVRPADLEPVRPYRLYLDWLKRQDLDAARRYWRDRLAGWIRPTPLPGRLTAADESTDERSIHRLHLSRDTTAALRSLARAERLTAATLLQGAWSILLARLAGETEVVFGTTVSGRPEDLPGAEDIVGPFINSLPVRVELDPSAPALPWMRRIQAQVAESSRFAYSPLVRIQEWSAMAPGERLFGSLVVFENYPLEVSLEHWGESLEIVDLDYADRAAGELTLLAIPGDELSLWLVHDPTRFEAGTAERLLEQLQVLLDALATAPQSRIGELRVLDEDARRRLAELSSPSPSVGGLEGATLPEVLWLQARRRGEETAVEEVGSGGRRWSWRELLAQAWSLARRLEDRGLPPGTLVALALPDAVDRIVAAWAAWWAGGAVVSLDLPSTEHWQARCHEAGCRWLLGRDLSEELLLPHTVDLGLLGAPGGLDLEDLEAAGFPSPTALAALTFKQDVPMQLEHRALVQRVERWLETVPVEPGQTVLARWQPGWTGDLHRLLAPLAGGAKIRVTGQGASHGLRESLEDGEVEMTWATRDELAVLEDHADLLVLVEDEDTRGGLLPSQAPEILEIRSAEPVGIVAWRRDPDSRAWRPASGLRWLVLDGLGDPAPLGSFGRLAVGGLTGVRAADDDPLRRLPYRGRWTAEGGLELLEPPGRRAWLRGVEVDLDHLEGELLRDGSVAECHVSSRDRSDGGRELVGYVVGPGPWTPESLRDRLTDRVPVAWHPVLPSSWMGMTSLPRTTRGEVDEAALRRLPVVDEELASQWESALGTAGVSEVAVVTRPCRPETERYHVSQLPGRWTESMQGSGRVEPGPDRSEPAEKEGAGPPSVAAGEALRTVAEGGRVPEVPASLTAALERAAAWSEEEPWRGVTYVEGETDEEHQSYADLLAEAERVVDTLRALELKPGEPVMLALGSPREFVPTFWGAVLGGFVPVPVGVPPVWEPGHTETEKVANAWRMLGEPPLVVESESRKPARERLRSWGGAGEGLVVSQDARRGARDRRRSGGCGEDLALLLLTSGSTGRPKGVRQSHRAILRREAATAACNGLTAEDVSLNWFPLDHVGGLVMFHVRDVYLSCRQVQGRLEAVLERPLVWLDWIDRYGATVTWAPNFAFGLVNERAVEVARGSWDLSSMRFVLNGGEAIVARTARRFLELLEPHGLSTDTMNPAWGMSETCSGVVYSERFDRMATRDEDEFVEVGRPVPEFSVRVVDEADHVVPEGREGRLQVRGPMVTTGYWDNPQADRESFTEDGWFVTGDLGVMREGRLTITGREKDVIIVRGNNVYSHEIEAVVEELEGVEVSYTAACGVRRGSDTDQLAIFFHPTGGVEGAEWAPLVRRLRQEVASRVGLSPEYVVPVERDEVPKTGIGKIQRRRLAEELESGRFDERLRQVDLALGNERTVPAWFHRRIWRLQAPAAPGTWPATGRWLVLGVDTELGLRLADGLSARGARVVSVAAGQGYEALGEDRFRLAPGEPSGYRRLLEDVGPVAGIVHLWTWDGAEAGDDRRRDEARELERGTYSLLYLSHALAPMEDRGETLRLVVAGRGTQAVDDTDGLDPARASLLGLLRTLPLEWPWVRCRHVDLSGLDAATEATHVLTELTSPGREPEVAWRRGQRRVPRLEAVDPRTGEAFEGGVSIEPGGFYLVTGGLGGIGRRLAQRLLDGWGARLLLVGRTELPPAGETDDERTAERRTALESLQQSATGHVLYRTVDVADAKGLETMVAEAERHWQRPLDGVFHLAGEGNLEYHWSVMDEHRVGVESREVFEGMLRPKAAGTRALDSLLEDRPRAFLLAFSSINSLMGGATFSAYSAANRYLDVFCRGRHGRGRPTMVVNWTLWDDLGMSSNNPTFARDAAGAMGYHILPARGGLASLGAVLARGEPRIVVGLDSTNLHVARWMAGEGRPLRELVAFSPTGSRSAAEGSRRSLSDRFDVPSSLRWVEVDELPRDEDGQVDRHLLRTSEDLGKSSVAEEASSELERRIAAIWKEVLGVHRVGRHDNFFELGGDSILSLQIVARLHRADLPLTPQQVFQHPTIAELAEVAEALDGAISIDQGPVTGAVPLTPVQHWFFQRDLSDPHRWDLSVSLTALRPLDPELLEAALGRLLEHHDALRLRFERIEGGWRQYLAEPGEVRDLVTVCDLESSTEADSESEEDLAERLRRGLDLHRGPLTRILLVRTPDQDDRVLWVIHHLAVDGVSWRVLITDLSTAYRQLEAGEDVSLPPKTSSFKTWAEHLEILADSAGLEGQVPYWCGLEDRRAEAGPLPVDHPQADDLHGVLSSSRRVSVRLDADETRDLLGNALKVHRARIDELLLAALVISLRRGLEVLEGHVDGILVDLESHGREPLFDGVDLSRTVGWFTSMFPVFFDPGQDPGTQDLATTLRAVKEAFRRIPDRGVGYGVLRWISGDQDVRDRLESLPEAPVGFNYLGRFEVGSEDSLLGEVSLLLPAEASLRPDQGGDERRPHQLEVAGWVLEERLTIEFSYSETLYRRETIEAVATSFRQALERWIEAGRAGEPLGLSPVDFPLADVDDQRLAEIAVAGEAVEDVYPLSPMQQGILFQALKVPGEYFEQMAFSLEGPVDSVALEGAWRRVVDRHPILRTGFEWSDLQEPLQVVRRHVELPWRVEDWSDLDEGERDRRLDALLEEDRRRGFDLTCAPLLRLTLIHLDETRWYMVWSHHHLLLDGWSAASVFDEVSKVYEAERAGHAAELPSPRPFSDFVAWLRQRDDAEERAFWRRLLETVDAPTRLAVERVDDLQGDDQPRLERRRVSSERTAALRAFARRHRLTLNTLVQGAWALVLSRYSGDPAPMFGITLAGRPAFLPGVEEMVGLFINTLPLRVPVPPEAELLPWLAELQRLHGEVGQHGHASLARVQEWSGVGRALFETILVFENYPIDMEVQRWGGDLEIRLHQPFVRTNFPLTLGVLPEDEMEIWGLFDPRRFHGVLVARILRHLEQVLAEMTVRPEAHLDELPMLGDSERTELEQRLDGGPTTLVAERPLPEIVLEKAREDGDAPALVGETGQLTYGELQERSERWARGLCGEGLRPGAVVGIHLEGALERALATLAVLAAGGACLWLRSEDPRQLAQWQLRDAGASWLLAPASLEVETPADVRRLDPTELDDGQGVALPDLDPDALAWVAYPTWRGVELDHRALSARVHRLAEAVGVSRRDGVLHRFDGAGWPWELWLAWSRGARAVAMDEDAGALPSPRWLARRDVDVARWTPGELAELLATAEGPPTQEGRVPLRAAFVGGGEITRALADRFAEATGGGLLYRIHGAVEAGEGLFGRIVEPGETAPRIPLGSVAAGSSVRLLDGRRWPVPPGVAGEIHAGGASVARGFTDARETGRRFWKEPGGVLRLATGDRGRVLESGEMVLADGQEGGCWVAGRRVDPTEIEAALMTHPVVSACAVLPRSVGSESELVAYYVANSSVSAERLTQLLCRRLPRERRPGRFVAVSNLPRTGAGLLDIEALRRLPVLDEATVDAWRRRLEEIPGVDAAVAVVEETIDPSEDRWHLQELVGSSRIDDRPSAPGRSVTEDRGSREESDGLGQDSADRPSVVHGGELHRPADAPTTVAEALQRAADLRPERGIHYPARDGSEEVQTYRELLQESRRVLGGLRRLGLESGDRVLFQLERPREFLPVFWACVLGGLIPVPLTVPSTHEGGYRQDGGAVDRVIGAWHLLDRPLTVGGADQVAALEGLKTEDGFEDWRLVSFDDLLLCDDSELQDIRPGDPDATALMLLTSGSTGNPKVVRQTQKTLLDRSLATAAHNHFDDRDVSLNWFPLDHVGGLVMFHLRDVVVGCRQIQGTTADVLDDPLRWLDWIERYRATITWAPNFAFGLVNDRVESSASRRWDLSSMRFVLNGGEAIVARTARRFLELLEPHGLSGTVMHPAWGMSETCSGVVYSHRFRRETTSDEDSFVEVGSPIAGMSLRIVDEEDRPVVEGSPGRLQVRGVSVTPGYWNHPDLNDQVFTEDGWFDTGDLGILRDGRLTITGRVKDVIIVHGVNYYSHELEAAVEEVPGVDVSYTAACPVREPGGDTDELAVFLTPLEEAAQEDLGNLLRRVREKLTGTFGVAPRYLVPVRREQVPKTAIGKIQRSRLREAFEAGGLDSELRRGDVALGNERTIPAWFFRLDWEPRLPRGRWPLRRRGRALLVSDSSAPGDLGGALLRRLDALGWSVEHLAAEPANDPEGFRQKVWQAVEAKDPVDWVVHLADRSGTGSPEGLDSTNAAILVHLAAALGQADDPERPVRLQVVTRGALRLHPGERPQPGAAALGALVGTLAQETPWLDARHLDLPKDPEPGDDERLLDEVLAVDRERQVACRSSGPERAVPILAPVDMMAEPAGELPVEAGGAYLVTGGLGGLGTEVARWLLGAHRCRLLLLGRTPREELGPHVRDRLDGLHELPGEVVYDAVDVTRGAALEIAVETAEARWGPLQGAFHLAGVLQERPLAQETRHGLETALAPKVQGALHLRRILSERPGSFLVAFSSVNGWLGGAGVGAYAAANAALDQVMAVAGDALPCWNISWSLWNDVGMSRGYSLAALSESRGFRALTPRQGCLSLEAVLRRPPGHWVVGLDPARPTVRERTGLPASPAERVTVYFTGDAGSASLPEVVDRFGRAVPASTVQVKEIPRDDEGRPDLSRLSEQASDRSRVGDGGTAPRSPAERRVAVIFRDLLEVDRVGRNESFFALGGHSLLATRLVNRLRSEFHVELPLERIFQEPTVAAIAQLLPAAENEEEASTREAPDDALVALERGGDSLAELLDAVETEEVG